MSGPMDVVIPEAKDEPGKPDAGKEPAKDSPPEKGTADPTTPPASEGAKTPEKKDGEPKKDEPKPESKPDSGFTKHSRFRELVREKNEALARTRELEEELSKARESKLPGASSDEDGLPKLETEEEVRDFLKTLPAKAAAEARAAIEAEHAQAAEKETGVQKIIDSQLQGLKDEGEDLPGLKYSLNGKDYSGEEALLAFATKHKIPDLGNAYRLMREVEEARADGSKRGEETAKRKLQSGTQERGSSPPVKEGSFIPGRSLDEAIEAAKAAIPN